MVIDPGRTRSNIAKSDKSRFDKESRIDEELEWWIIGTGLATMF